VPQDGHLVPQDGHLVPQDGQQQRHRHPSPHPSAWHIYAPPATTQPQPFAPPHMEPHSHQPPLSDTVQAPEVDTRHHRHRPPPLDLSDTEVLSNTLGLLNFRQ
jgi:hypothetical protein